MEKMYYVGYARNYPFKGRKKYAVTHLTAVPDCHLSMITVFAKSKKQAFLKAELQLFEFRKISRF